MKLLRDHIILELLPERGGGIARFAFDELEIFRPLVANDASPLGLSCFPLVPFSGRIARGIFCAGEQVLGLPINFKDEPLHAIHGHGWQAPWQITAHEASSATMRFDYDAGDWPWAYRAEQGIHLHESGYRHELSVQNLGDAPMPTGLGLHPYFPRAGASIATRFSARWAIDEARLPSQLEPIVGEIDWFGGSLIDAGFERQSGPIKLSWPTHTLSITPNADLNHTVIYIPPGENFFCIEPVSHVANAVNHGGMRWLAPREVWNTSVDFSVTRVKDEL